MIHTVQVWDRPYEVSVHQKSKTVWIAVGDYHGERIETNGRNEDQAVEAWRRPAIKETDAMTQAIQLLEP